MSLIDRIFAHQHKLPVVMVYRRIHHVHVI